MTWLFYCAALVLLALGRFVLLRRGLITPRHLRNLSTWDRVRKVCDPLDSEIARATVAPVCGATEADGSHRSREQRANPGIKTPGRSASAHPIPEVQREIEMRDVWSAAQAFARSRPFDIVTIHEHQADKHGREKRN